MKAYSNKTILVATGAVLLVGAIVVFSLPGENQSKARDQDEAQPVADASQSTKSGLAAYDENGDGIVYQDGMHPWIVLDAPGLSPDCNMPLTPVRVDGSAEPGTVEIDPVTMQNIGVRTAEVAVEPLGRSIRTTGRFTMNEEGTETVSLKVGGWVEELFADFDGVIVQRGQPLLELYSPKLVATQQEFLLALNNAQRLEGGPAEGDARRLLEAALRRLTYWDLTQAQIQRLKATGEPQRTITFYAPISGEVMNKQVVEGQHIRPGQSLMDIVDISEVWLIVDVYEQDMPWIEVGTPARIELASNPGKVYTGRVDYIYHMIERETRTAKARITLPGGHHTPMKPGAYAAVYLSSGITEPTPVVPAEAVLWTGEREVVLLALGDGRFRPIEIETGLQGDGRVQILEGLEGGEPIVTSAQFLIGSEAQLQSALAAMTTGTEGE